MTQQDLDVRIWMTKQAYAEMSDTYNSNLKYGRKCSNIDVETLIILCAYIELLECFNLLKTNNCVTEDELKIIIDNISLITGLIFPPYDFTFNNNTSTIVPINLIYYGSSSLTSLTSSEVQLLQNSFNSSTLASLKLYPSNDYKYYAYPSTLGLATHFIDNLTSLNVPMDTMFNVTISSIVYNVHRTYYPIVSSISIKIS